MAINPYEPNSLGPQPFAGQPNGQQRIQPPNYKPQRDGGFVPPDYQGQPNGQPQIQPEAFPGGNYGDPRPNYANPQGWQSKRADGKFDMGNGLIVDPLKEGYTPGGIPLSKVGYTQGADGRWAMGQGGNQQGQNNLGMGGGQGYNPYLKQMGADITRQMTDNFNQNQLPAMRSGALAAGGFGGSRQGVIESNGLNQLNLGIGQNLTNLYGQDWTNQQNRNLTNKGLDNNYDLGLRSNDLGYANLDANINQNNFNNQLNGANFGLDVYNTMQNGNNLGLNAGNQIQQTPLDYQQYFSDAQNGIGQGYGTNTKNKNLQGDPYTGVLGGSMMGNDLYNQYK